MHVHCLSMRTHATNQGQFSGIESLVMHALVMLCLFQTSRLACAVIYLFSCIYIGFAGFSGELLAELTASQLSLGYQSRKPGSL